MPTNNDDFGVPSYKDDSTKEVFKKRAIPKRLGNSNPVEVVRIIPPIKSCKDRGVYARYLILHWGFKGVSPKDATKTFLVVFVCPRTFSKTVACVLCDQIAQKKDGYETLLAKCKTEGKTLEETETIGAPLKEWLRTFNADGGYYMNVMNQKGEFYPLKINSTTRTALESELKKYDKGVAMSVDKGLWFRFEFVNGGKNNKVEVVHEAVQLPDGSTAYKNKSAPLNDEQKLLAKDCPDLNLEIARIITSEKVEMLVNCSGDPEDVMKILNLEDKVSAPTVDSGNRGDSAPSPGTDDDFFAQYRT